MINCILRGVSEIFNEIMKYLAEIPLNQYVHKTDRLNDSVYFMYVKLKLRSRIIIIIQLGVNTRF
jgi:predicted sulfurtransferase